MNRSKPVNLTLAIVITIAAVAAGALSGRIWSTGKVYAQSVPVALTAEIRTRSYDGAGVERHSAIETYARRSDGSHILLRRIVNEQELGVRIVTDASRRMRVTVDPQTGSTISYSLSQDEAAALRALPATCEEGPEMQLDSRPQERILGHEVVHLVGKTRGSEHSLQKWVAPGLNCLTLRSETLTGGFRNVREVTSITLGEPDSNLFLIPEHYTERPPSQVLAIARTGAGRVPMNPKISQALDAVYQNRQAKR
jgi:hypothetical protein